MKNVSRDKTGLGVGMELGFAMGWTEINGEGEGKWRRR
jgi:hypothetical protein